MKKKYFVFVLVLGVIIPLIIQILFCFHPRYRILQANWEAGDILTYIGTVFLGGIAAWQNERLKSSNDESQARLEKLTDKANQLSYISKVVEYELLKKEKLEKSIENFQNAASSQNIVTCLIEDKINAERVMNIENNLDEAYLTISAILDSHNDTNIVAYKRNVVIVNQNFKRALTILKQNMSNPRLSITDTEEIKEIMKNLNELRLEMEKEKAIFLMNYQKQLDRLIYGENYKLEEIQAIY